jgi:hypothetical protein
MSSWFYRPPSEFLILQTVQRVPDFTACSIGSWLFEKAVQLVPDSTGRPVSSWFYRLFSEFLILQPVELVPDYLKWLFNEFLILQAAQWVSDFTDCSMSSRLFVQAVQILPDRPDCSAIPECLYRPSVSDRLCRLLYEFQIVQAVQWIIVREGCWMSTWLSFAGTELCASCTGWLSFYCGLIHDAINI